MKKIKCLYQFLKFWMKDIIDIICNINMDKQQGFICLECGIKYPNKILKKIKEIK